jgi:hypothetical protein
MTSLAVTNQQGTNHKPNTPNLGCMRDYDLVVYTAFDLKAISDMEKCHQGLTSSAHKRDVSHMLLHYHTSMRLRPFIERYGLRRGERAGCPCTKIDELRSEPDCMHTGEFDPDRFRARYMQSHCLICSTRNCEGEICDHQVLHDDCIKIQSPHSPIGLLHANEDELHIAGNVPYKVLLEEFSSTDKTEREWEDNNWRIYSTREDDLFDSWPAWVQQAQITLLEFTQKQAYRRCFEANWLAMAMGQHPRLGAKSLTSCMDPEILHIVMKSI